MSIVVCSVADKKVQNLILIVKFVYRFHQTIYEEYLNIDRIAQEANVHFLPIFLVLLLNILYWNRSENSFK